MTMEIFSLMYKFTWIFVFIFSLLGVSITLKGENIITIYSFTTLIHRHIHTPLKISSEIKVKKKNQSRIFQIHASFLFFYFLFLVLSTHFFGLLFTKNYKMCQCRGHMLKVNGILFLLAFYLLLAGFLRSVIWKSSFCTVDDFP